MIKTKRIHLQPRGTTRGRCGLLPNYWRRSSGWTNYDNITFIWQKGIKGKGFPYSIPSVGPGAYPDVQAVSPSPGGRLTLLSARLAVTFPAAEHHCPLAGTKLYCFVTEAHRCEQLAQGCYAVLPWVGYEPTTCWSQVQRSTRCATFIWLSDAKNCTTDTNKAAITDHVAEKSHVIDWSGAKILDRESHRKTRQLKRVYLHTLGGQLSEQRWGSPQPTYDRILVTCSSSTSRDHMPDEVSRWRTKRCN